MSENPLFMGKSAIDEQRQTNLKSIPHNEKLGEVKSSIYAVFGTIFVPIWYHLETEIYRVMQVCQKNSLQEQLKKILT